MKDYAEIIRAQLRNFGATLQVLGNETDWAFITRDLAVGMHDDPVAEYGGRPGVREQGMLDSALGKPG